MYPYPFPQSVIIHVTIFFIINSNVFDIQTNRFLRTNMGEKKSFMLKMCGLIVSSRFFKEFSIISESVHLVFDLTNHDDNIEVFEEQFLGLPGHKVVTKDADFVTRQVAFPRQRYVHFLWIEARDPALKLL